MRRALVLLAVIVLGWGMVGGAAAAEPDAPVAFDADRAVVSAAASGATLLDRSAVLSGADLVREFLRAGGRTRVTVDSLVATGESTSRGVRHVRFAQVVGGLQVAGAYVKAAFNARGDLVHVIDNTVDLRGVPAGTNVSPDQALDASLTRVHPDAADRPAAAGRSGKVTTFKRTAFFHAAPRAERVVIARTSGALEEGFVVETWSQEKNVLHETLVGRNGRVVATELRTAEDSYNVFTEDPGKGPQQLVAGPGAGNAESPAGWLFAGPQRSIGINGNNASSYLDADSNNQPDKGGTTIGDGNFLAVANLGESPTTATNRAVGVQNVFYLNNVIHDILYGHGFTEDVGNFQVSNFGGGGADRDPVNAEVQDGSGTDNANFATPKDGKRPRMQMFLWTGFGPTHEVVIDGTSFNAREAEFSKLLSTTGVTGPLAVVNDGVGAVTDACEPLPRRSLDGLVAVVERGTCTFVVKVATVQAAGAIGMVVADNQAGDPFVMGGSPKGVKIPAVMVSQADGATLMGLAPAAATVRRLAVQPIQIDSSLDADVVFHEYGHGLTWRMIGGMSGPLGGAIGEGASDAVALLVNGDDVVGEYSSSDPAGIRRFPYGGYPLTYAGMNSGEVHDDGELFGAILWRLSQDYPANGLTVDGLFTTFVDGMNFTPATPAYEDMRDGMLDSVTAQGASASGQTCLIWDAYADFGVGIGANGVVNADGTVTITESFDKPAGC